ncbi:MAG: shikimate kinase [Coriobacteriales bacterium]|nr:shikimate kinase [Coriobacteriales bacterium]
MGCDHIFFIGFLGAGKSTVARNLGRLFNRRHLDTDRMVVYREHASVAELFSTIGEEKFRECERRALEQLSLEKSCLVSCGGGIIESHSNTEYMKTLGKVVFLDIGLDEALSHICHPEIRPDLGDYEHAKLLYDHRLPLYRDAADFTVDIRGLSFSEVAYTVGGMLYEAGLL